MQTFLRKTLTIAVISLVAGAAGALGNALGTRYLVPLVEDKLPSRTTTGDEPQDMPVSASTGFPPR